MPTHDKFVETYDCWLRASDQHREMMAAVMQGAPLDMKAMQEKVAEIQRLHDDWMALASRAL